MCEVLCLAFTWRASASGNAAAAVRRQPEISGELRPENLKN